MPEFRKKARQADYVLPAGNCGPIYTSDKDIYSVNKKQMIVRKGAGLEGVLGFKKYNLYRFFQPLIMK